MTVPEDGQHTEESDEEWSRRLDELDERAQRADDGGNPREVVEAYVDLAEHLAGVADHDVVIELLLVAREACLEVDPARATELLQTVGLLAHTAGDFGSAYDAFGIACEELSSVADPEHFASSLNDFGAMCTQVGEFDEGEEVLRMAESIYLDRRLLHDAAEVRLNLANNLYQSGRGADAERLLSELVDFFGHDSVRQAMCLTSLAAVHVESGRAHLARPAVERAIKIFESAGDAEHAAESRMGLALVLLGSGEVDRGETLLAEVIDYYESIGKPDRVAICEYNRANAATARHDFAVADAAFDAASNGLAAAGMHHQLAKLQWNRVKRLTTEAALDPQRQATLGAEAVDTAVASLIASDYERFQFTDSWRRARWRDTLEHRMTWTFLLAYKLGATTVTADLIDTMINAGVYGFSGTLMPDEPVALDVSTGPRAGAAMQDEPPTSLVLGLAATFLRTAELPMAPPPALVDGNGRLLLERQRAMAAALDPDLAAVLETAPRVQIW